MTGKDGYSGRAQPMYTMSEAAHLAHVAPVTVRRWLYGYAPDRRHPNWRTPPVFGDRDTLSPHVSFLQLIEIVVAADFRKVSRVKLDVITAAHRNARTEFGIEYPFAHEDLNLESLGGHIVKWIMGDTPHAQAIDSPEQFSLPGLVDHRIHQLDYDKSLASRWHPIGQNVPIVIDPLFAAGLPTVEGRGVSIQAIHRRWLADQKIDFIARDLHLDRELVEKALQYAEKVAA
jgi:uncharacterized protein (DUF433 family)